MPLSADGTSKFLPQVGSWGSWGRANPNQNWAHCEFSAPDCAGLVGRVHENSPIRGLVNGYSVCADFGMRLLNLYRRNCPYAVARTYLITPTCGARPPVAYRSIQFTTSLLGLVFGICDERTATPQPKLVLVARTYFGFDDLIDQRLLRAQASATRPVFIGAESG
jgi:hypothetical protein